MCYLCYILIGFVAQSNISQEVKLNLNQTGLGFVWLVPHGRGGVVHKDSLWQQLASSCKFDQHLKANKGLPRQVVCVLYVGRGRGGFLLNDSCVSVCVCVFCLFVCF